VAEAARLLRDSVIASANMESENKYFTPPRGCPKGAITERGFATLGSVSSGERGRMLDTINLAGRTLGQSHGGME
jgi:hypothetical protein